ncbi:RT0821/Lpp0805 family surface protein [Consotaella salsifontis]|uniref:Surface antigen n=1 Tax=Consotaella salsifontis TaxID=1365950 RepID=A0A1T4LK19_9HYPH|nr:RT0821/Lpp0805 family surface protein [Consotaella salsifontis]SJZ55112.1 Surface antigen [Consotaella salsifontis]
MGPKTATGAGAGAMVGGLACALAGGKTGQCLVAAVAGAIVGGAIGAQLDERDRQRRQAALMEAVREEQYWASQRRHAAAKPSTPRKVAWTNPDTGNRGTITPLRTVVKNDRECRVMQETYFKDGEPITGETTVCKQADGSWS